MPRLHPAGRPVPWSSLPLGLSGWMPQCDGLPYMPDNFQPLLVWLDERLASNLHGCCKLNEVGEAWSRGGCVACGRERGRGAGVTGQGVCYWMEIRLPPLSVPCFAGPPGGLLQPCCCHTTSFLIWFNEYVAHVPYLHCLQAPVLSPSSSLLFILFMFTAASNFSLSIRFSCFSPTQPLRCSMLFCSLLALPQLTRFLLWPSTAAVVVSVSLYRTTTIYLSLSASNVHTFGGCCVRISLPDNNGISL